MYSRRKQKEKCSVAADAPDVAVMNGPAKMGHETRKIARMPQKGASSLGGTAAHDIVNVTRVARDVVDALHKDEERLKHQNGERGKPGVPVMVGAHNTEAHYDQEYGAHQGKKTRMYTSSAARR